MLRRAPSEQLSEQTAWALLLGLSQRVRDGRPILERTGLQLEADGTVREVPPAQGWVVARPDLPDGWTGPESAPTLDEPLDAARWATIQLLDIYMPLCVGARCRNLTVGHLAQSLDGRIATVGGVSQFITGKENLVHAHRMRALFDAVLVGARTVEHDDPRLTTRLVSGPHPCRIVLDPRGRLRPDHRMFTDGEAPTLVFVGRKRARAQEWRDRGVEFVEIDEFEGRLPASRILDELKRRNLRRVFVEGGGVTISRLLQAGSLQRLHVAVAPMLMGSGRPSVALPVIERLSDALTVKCRHFKTGPDMMFDCDLSD